MPTVREATCKILRSYGVKAFFGNPGSNELPFLDEFPPDSCYVLGPHGRAAVALADEYAQAPGETVLVNCRPGLLAYDTKRVAVRSGDTTSRRGQPRERRELERGNASRCGRSFG